VKLGIVVLTTDESAPIDVLAREIESRGLDSLYFGGDHTHVPVSRESPFPGGGDPEMPEEYTRTYDPLIASAWAAAATSSIRLGTCVFLAAQRDPISTAKQVASVDRLSGGRFDFGVGYGWNVEEAASHGAEWASRRERVRDYVLAMKELWTQEQASYSSEFVSLEPSWMWPKPVSDGPRVIIGAGPGPRTFAAITEWGDGWFPLPYWGHTPEHVTRLRAFADERGRDPDELAIVVDGVLAEPAYLDPWAEIGAEAALVPVPSTGIDDVAPILDTAASLIDRYA
jgi:probable F420-dependent oxidoreductase